MNIGIAGIGFMGMIHYLTYQKIPAANVVAICELDQKRLAGDWRDIQGNFGPAGTMMDLSGVATYQDFGELIADSSVQLIDITLPPGLHRPMTCRALAAGKDVFCEKPMALAATDCDEMVAEAKRQQRQLLIGHVLPFLPEYAWALEIVQSGRYGPLSGGSFRRVISDPAWLENYWQPELIGGPMLDLHVHDAHFIRLLFGMPESLVSRGRLRGNCAEFWHTDFQFANRDLVVQATGGTIPQPGRGFNHGFEIHLEAATLQFEFAVFGDAGTYLCPPTLLDNHGNVERPELPAGDPMLNAFQAELSAVVQAVQNGSDAPVLAAALARDAIQLCHKQTESIVKGTAIKV